MDKEEKIVTKMILRGATIAILIVLIIFAILGRDANAAQLNQDGRQALSLEEIPVITGEKEGEYNLLGIPFNYDIEWDESGRVPLFKYKYTRWEIVYKLKGGMFLVKEGEYYMLISLVGKEGPVWAYWSAASIDGEIIAVTDNFLVYKNGEEKIAMSPEGKNFYYSDLSVEEKSSIVEAVKVNIKFTSNVNIDRWLDSKISWQVIEDGAAVDIFFGGYIQGTDTTIYLCDQEWFQYQSEQMFFIQTGFDPREKTAGFLANVDGEEKVMLISFEADTFIGAGAYGITYKRDGVKYFKSYYSINVGGDEYFPEVPSEAMYCGVEFPKAGNLDIYESTSPAVRGAPF